MTERILERFRFVAALVAISGGCFSLWDLSSGKPLFPRHELFLWALLPPLWYALEHVLFAQIHRGARAKELTHPTDPGVLYYRTKRERLKDGQDLTAKIWAAVGILIGILYKAS